MGFWRKEQISFFVTSKCNLSCYYCYMPKLKVNPADELLSLDFARAGLKDFFSTSSSRAIRFFSSGEPTQAFDRVKEIWHVAHTMAGHSLKTEMETNGFFSEGVADWVERHVDILWISFDGPPDIQDVQRPACGGLNSSKVVTENVMRFAKNSKMQFGVRATISPENLNKQIQLIEYFHGLGIKFVAASPTYHSKVNQRIKTPSLLEFAKHFVSAFFRARELNMFYQTLLIVNFDEEVDSYCQACKPCPRLTTDGYVSCCDWASFGPSYLPGALQECIYGQYNQPNDKIIYDHEKIERIRRRSVQFLGQNYCRGCRALRHCAGGCLGKMIAATNNLYEASQDWCEAVRFLFDRLPVKCGLYPFLHP